MRIIDSSRRYGAHRISRRRVLGGALAGAAGLAAGALVPRLTLAGADSPAGSGILHTALSDTLHLFQGAGGNVVAAMAADGVLMVDGGLEQHSPALLAQVAAVSGGRPVKLLLNTHWHWDHTGSNATLGKAGARIIAHENTRLWLGTRVDSKWEHRVYPPQPAHAWPTQTFFYGSQKLEFGGQDVEYAIMPQAHTDGDIYVIFPRENVLVAGGVVSGGGYPLPDYCTGGWLGGMIDGLKMLLAKADAGTRIISGAGATRTREDLQAQLDLCTAVLAKIGTSYFKGQTWQEFQASGPTAEFDARWGNPDPFLKMAYDGAWYHVNEIRRYSR
ncbi:MAG TPA: MBL fold metallo-hydrolase [Steroidobacteraceae bacterium]|nr:MBL fold metallo-hydrolase [Steroidobacteraceae bacterium]